MLTTYLTIRICLNHLLEAIRPSVGRQCYHLGLRALRLFLCDLLLLKTMLYPPCESSDSIQARQILDKAVEDHLLPFVALA